MDTASTDRYTLSLHDALPISLLADDEIAPTANRDALESAVRVRAERAAHDVRVRGAFARSLRSEEHTSELQSPYDLVCRLMLEKKNYQNITNYDNTESYIHHT